MKPQRGNWLDRAMCDIIGRIGKLALAGQNIVEQWSILSGLT